MPAAEPLVAVHGLDAGGECRRLGPRPAQDPPHLGHHGEADVTVDLDLGQGALAQHALDGASVSGSREAEQFLMAVREVVVLVVADHPDGLAQLRMVAEVLDQHVHLVGRTLFGDPAVGQIDHDVLLGQGLLTTELVMGEPNAVALQEHRVVGLRGHRHGFEPALVQERVEDPAVLVLVGAVSGDLGREIGHPVGHQGCDAAILPTPWDSPLAAMEQNSWKESSWSMISWKRLRAESITATS